jgi:hypothetical protein
MRRLVAFAGGGEPLLPIAGRGGADPTTASPVTELIDSRTIDLEALRLDER